MDRPYIFCHMMTSIDGKIMGSYMDTPEGETAVKEFYNIAFGSNPHYKHQGWLSGRISSDDNFTFYKQPYWMKTHLLCRRVTLWLWQMHLYEEFSIADDYAEKCRNYFVSFKVPLDIADIESTDAFIGKRQKSDLLVKYSINAMAHYLKAGKRNKGFYNPIIMLKRDYNVPHADIIKVRSLKIDYPKVRVIDD